MSFTAISPMITDEHIINEYESRKYELTSLTLQLGSVKPYDKAAVYTALIDKRKEFAHIKSVLDGLNLSHTPIFSDSYFIETVIVPDNLPLFQWTKNVWRPESHVFDDILDVLIEFQEIMLEHNLNCDSNFARLTPLLLSRYQRMWYSDLLVLHQAKPLSWNEFMGACMEEYGNSVIENRGSAAVELVRLEMYKHESIDSFIGRFNNLRSRSVDYCPVSSVLTLLFVKALPYQVQMDLAVRRCTLSPRDRMDIDITMNLVSIIEEWIIRTRLLLKKQKHKQKRKQNKRRFRKSNANGYCSCSDRNEKFTQQQYY